MKRKAFKSILALSIWCMSHSVVYANHMKLIYDGKEHFYSNKPIGLYIDGQEIVTKVMPPIQLNGSVLVPAKEVFSTLGAEVEWRSSEKSIYVHNNETLIVLKMNSSEAWVNGETKYLNMPAKLINDKVMIPLRFIGESLGYTVKWVQESSSVYILSQEEDWSSTSEVNNNIQNTIPSIEGSNTGQNIDITNQEQEDKDIPQISDLIQDTNLSTSLENGCLSYLGLSNSLILNGIEGLQPSQITYEENPYTKQIVVDLNSDYSQYLQEGNYAFQEGSIKQVNISHQIGTTRLTLTTSTIQALSISQNNDSIILQAVKPSDKYGKIVVLDAGHGAHDSGATYNGIKEKDLNLAISQELAHLLEADPEIKVYTTREDDTFLELMERVEVSNQIDPDLFISIHINSAPQTASASGTETYYTVASDTRNKTFATMVQKALVNEFGTKNRGVKTNTFIVTKYTNAPAILIEIGFITNEADRAMMTSSDFTSRYAQTVYRCILEYYAAGLNEYPVE